MGQQLPFSPNGQNAYGQPLPAAQSPMASQPLAMPGAAAPFNPAIAAPGQAGGPLPGGIPGVDPKLMNAAQQSLANPNGGDVNTIFPGPESLLKGAGVGLGVSLGMGYLTRPENNMFHKTAKLLDKFPGSAWVKGLVDPYIQANSDKSAWISKHKNIQEFLMPQAHLEKGANDEARDKAVKGTISTMEQNQLNGVLGPYQKKFLKQPEPLKAAYSETLEALKAKGHTPHKYLEAVGAEQVVHSDANFKSVLHDLEAQVQHLKDLPNKTKEQKALQKTLRNVKERIGGINNWYKPLYESQVEMTAKLSAEGVGPIGRSFAGFANYLQRIFNGSTMGMGQKTAEKTAGQVAEKIGFFKQAGKFITEKGGMLFGPLMMGATIFGFSFQAAHNAKDGEKNKTFFHNLLGSQIFNFIGWEFGRKVFNSMELGSKVFGRIAGKTLPGFLSKIPILGGITLAGFGTEIAAMLIFGTIFQKVGEKISGAIFGKPSQASIDGKGRSQNQQNQQSQANPALSGMINPAMMGQAMQQANMAPRPAGWAPQQGPQAAAPQFPAQAYPTQPRAAASSAANLPPYAGPRMANVSQPSRPKFSITPQEISRSIPATDYDNVYKNILSNKEFKKLDKSPSQLLDRTQ